MNLKKLRREIDSLLILEDYLKKTVILTKHKERIRKVIENLEALHEDALRKEGSQ